MTAEEFISQLVNITHVTVGEPRRSRLVALYDSVKTEAREEMAYDLAQWVDGQAKKGKLPP